MKIKLKKWENSGLKSFNNDFNIVYIPKILLSKIIDNNYPFARIYLIKIYSYCLYIWFYSKKKNIFIVE